jgi:HK97 family phage portal protein
VTSIAGKLGLLGRLKLAGSLVLRGLVGEMVEHFRRAGEMGTGGKDRPSRPYSQVIAVYACVRAKADAISRLPLRISDAADNVIESGPLVMLAERPSAQQTGRRFWRETSALIDLFGRVHWHLVRDGAGRVVEVIVLNPLQMEPVVNTGTGELAGWKFHAFGRLRGRTETLALDEVHTIVDPDYEQPEKPWEGLGPRSAAAAAIAQYFKADLANESSLDNDCEPGGVFTMEGVPTKEQVDDTRQQISERHTGARNRRRFLMLYGGLKFDRMTAAFNEMEFSTLKFMSREDVCVAFGVNPLVIGYGGREGLGSGQHTDAAQEIFWENAVLPRAEWFAEEWSGAVASSWSADASLSMRDAVRRAMPVATIKARTVRFAREHARRSGLKFFAWFDVAGVGPVQRGALRVAEAASKWIERGVPLNQVLAAYDLPFEEVPWGDTWYKPFGLVDVQEEGASLPPGDTDPAGPEPEDLEEETANAQSPDRQITRSPNTTDAQRRRLWMLWRDSWRPIERSMLAKLGRHQYELRKETLRNLERVLGDTLNGLTGERADPSTQSPVNPVTRDLIGQILFDIVAAKRRLAVSVRPLIRAGYAVGGAQSMAEAAVASGKTPDQAAPFNIKDPNLQPLMRAREIRITETDESLRRRLAKSLADGLAKEETSAQLAERVREQFKFAGARARTIAMTEVGGAVEESRQVGRDQAKVPLKSWLGSAKETSRPWHMEMERVTAGNPIPNDALFTLPKTGASTPYPRGPGLGADDAANCACSTLAHFGDAGKDARLVDHLLTRGFVSADQIHPKGTEDAENHEGADHEDR